MLSTIGLESVICTYMYFPWCTVVIFHIEDLGGKLTQILPLTIGNKSAFAPAAHVTGAHPLPPLISHGRTVEEKHYVHPTRQGQDSLQPSEVYITATKKKHKARKELCNTFAHGTSSNCLG